MKTACLAPRTGVLRRVDFSIVRGRVSAVVAVSLRQLSANVN